MPEPREDGQGCQVWWLGQQAVVVLPGQVGVFNAGQVADQLLAAVDQRAAVLIVDMTATRSCDYAGTGALAQAYRRAMTHGTELRLVIPAPAVRRVVALSGLGQLVPVFTALEAAEAAAPPPAVVLPLRPKAAGSGPAAPAPRGEPRPVTRLPAPSPAGPGDFERAARPGMRPHESDDLLTRLIDGIFHAGLALQGALDEPADSLGKAAEHALNLLDETVREARGTVFAAQCGSGRDVQDEEEEEGAATAEGGPAQAAAGAGWGTTAVVKGEELRAESRSLRTRSREARAHSNRLAVLSAATQDRLAETLGELAASDWRRSTGLRFPGEQDAQASD